MRSLVDRAVAFCVHAVWKYFVLMRVVLGFKTDTQHDFLRG